MNTIRKPIPADVLSRVLTASEVFIRHILASTRVITVQHGFRRNVSFRLTAAGVKAWSVLNISRNRYDPDLYRVRVGFALVRPVQDVEFIVRTYNIDPDATVEENCLYQ